MNNDDQEFLNMIEHVAEKLIAKIIRRRDVYMFPIEPRRDGGRGECSNAATDKGGFYECSNAATNKDPGGGGVIMNRNFIFRDNNMMDVFYDMGHDFGWKDAKIFLNWMGFKAAEVPKTKIGESEAYDKVMKGEDAHASRGFLRWDGENSVVFEDLNYFLAEAKIPRGRASKPIVRNIMAMIIKWLNDLTSAGGENNQWHNYIVQDQGVDQQDPAIIESLQRKDAKNNQKAMGGLMPVAPNNANANVDVIARIKAEMNMNAKNINDLACECINEVHWESLKCVKTPASFNDSRNRNQKIPIGEGSTYPNTVPDWKQSGVLLIAKGKKNIFSFYILGDVRGNDADVRGGFKIGNNIWKRWGSGSVYHNNVILEPSVIRAEEGTPFRNYNTHIITPNIFHNISMHQRKIFARLFKYAGDHFQIVMTANSWVKGKQIPKLWFSSHDRNAIAAALNITISNVRNDEARRLCCGVMALSQSIVERVEGTGERAGTIEYDYNLRWVGTFIPTAYNAIYKNVRANVIHWLRRTKPAVHALIARHADRTWIRDPRSGYLLSLPAAWEAIKTNTRAGEYILLQNKKTKKILSTKKFMEEVKGVQCPGCNDDLHYASCDAADCKCSGFIQGGEHAGVCGACGHLQLAHSLQGGRRKARRKRRKKHKNTRKRKHRKKRRNTRKRRHRKKRRNTHRRKRRKRTRRH